MMKKYKQGLISGNDFWDYAFSEWKIHANKDEIMNILQEGYDLNGKKKEIMRLLDENKIKRIICTNNFPERIIILDEHFDFLEEFDYIVLSYEHKLLKPELLSVVSEVSGIDNTDITYFDDNKKNIDYARALGMNAIQIKEPSRVLKNLKEILNA
jgi:HAD superfamily hydrolase (TIGR01509 family)